MISFWFLIVGWDDFLALGLIGLTYGIALLAQAYGFLAVLAGLAGARCSRRELKLMSWFGIRGIGSLYYLMYAIEAGPPAELTEKLTSLVLTVVAASIAVHGISATPVMRRSGGGAR